MTVHRDLKRRIRERQSKTAESYVSARLHVLREREASAGLSSQDVRRPDPERVEAVVLKVGISSARVRILGEEGQVTFRSGDVSQVVPGHVATLVVRKRWTWRGDAYASGDIENPRVDVARLGLEPLPLHDGLPEDLRSAYEAYEDPDPYAPLWRELTARPRPCFEMDAIAWGARPGSEDENLTCDAAELMDAGDHDGARELLMEAAWRDLRCLDAHAHLGNLVFDRRPERALLHYEVGIRIGELSLLPGFEPAGALVWGLLYNRPFLRCLHGCGLCLWRLGRLDEAERVFERILSLNPNDNQGARFCWDDVRHGRRWEDCQAAEERRDPLDPPTAY